MSLTSYALDGAVATITLDDGKVNALSPTMLGEVSAALDRAEADGAVVVLTGRASTFSAGFDLRTPPEGWPEMLVAGARLAERLLDFPRPTVVACNGNAIAMGALVLLSTDLRIGVAGPAKIGLNEVAIGLTLPWFGIALAQHRLTKTASDRAAVTGALVGPEDARADGFLDRVVEPEALTEAAQAAARELAGVNMPAHHATKRRVRETVLAGVRDGIERLQTREAGDW